MRRAAFVRVGCVTLANRFQSGCRYWCHTVSVFHCVQDAATWVAAFQKGRRYLDGEYGSYYRIYCSTFTYWCTIHVRSGTVSVIVLRQRAIGTGLGKVSCDIYLCEPGT